mgnify:FL=1
MAESGNLEGFRDLPTLNTEWCQTDFNSQQQRAKPTRLHYDHGATPSRSDEPPDMLTENDGNGDKMAAVQVFEHGRPLPPPRGAV